MEGRGDEATIEHGNGCPICREQVPNRRSDTSVSAPDSVMMIDQPVRARRWRGDRACTNALRRHERQREQRPARPAIGGRSDVPSRVRLLEINPEIANQTTVLAT
jgi:hypothetical protein